MNFNITIGQYYPTKSVIHSLDPRVKLLATFNFIAVLFIADGFLGYAISGALILSIIKLSKVPLKFILKGLRALLFIISFTIIINLLFAPGETVLVSFWRISISTESLLWALQMGSRLIMLIVCSSVLTLTTSPISLTAAIETLLKPLKRIRFPVHEIAMMMTIALRFIPTLLEEADKIMKAQMARGASFDTGNIVKRAKSLIPVLVPLFISSFRRADELAIAMEARCYRGDINRTRMNILQYQRRDLFAGFVLGMYTIIVIILRVM